MANTTDKFRELSASLKADAAALRRDGVWGCCVGTYEYAAAHIDAILCESEAQEDAGAAEAWERRLRGRAGPFDGSLTAVIDQKPVTVERAREALERFIADHERVVAELRMRAERAEARVAELEQQLTAMQGGEA